MPNTHKSAHNQNDARHSVYFLCTHIYFLIFTLACLTTVTRRPASADRTAHCQFQATGQPVSQAQASDAMTSWLPRYEAKCVQCRCFQCGSVPLHTDIKGTELPPANIWIPLERQLIAVQLSRWKFYITKLCSRLFVLDCRNCPKDDKFR